MEAMYCTVFIVYIVFTVQTCLNSSVYAKIYIGKEGKNAIGIG